MNLTVDKGRCIDCGACVEVCLPGLFRRGAEGIQLKVTGRGCMDCGHCTAVCPTQGVEGDNLRCATAIPPPLVR